MAMNAKSMLVFSEEDYERPSGCDLEALMESVGWDRSQLGSVVGVRPNKVNDTVSNWLSGAVQIPYAEWRLALIESGAVQAEPDSSNATAELEVPDEFLADWKSGEYKTPPPELIKSLKDACGWTQPDIAKLIGVGWNPKKGSGAVRKLLAPQDSKAYVKARYATWRLMLIAAGLT